MFDNSNPYAVLGNSHSVAEQSVSVRTLFIRKTYMHLAGAVLAFVAIEAVLLTTIPAEKILGLLAGRYSWLIVLGLFMGVSWLANSWAQSQTSRAMQYAGLILYVVAEAVIFLPLLAIAMRVDPSIAPKAGLITGILFVGMTLMVFVTRADLSWMGKVLWIAGLLAFAAIIASVFLQVSLGMWFSIAMIGFASCYILYQTSNVLHHYNTEQYVAAALALFASVALLAWYVVRLLMALRDE